MRVLVAYATKAGSTRGVAKAICDQLRASGDDVTIQPLPADARIDLGAYDAVVIASAIRQRRWLKPAAEFLRSNAEHLSEKTVAYAAVCLAVVHGSRLADAESTRYRRIPVELAPGIVPVANDVFAGALDDAALTPGERLYVKAFGVPPGDYRDWDAIREWTRRAHEAIARAQGVAETVAAR